MIGYWARRVQRHQARRTFREYGFDVHRFQLPRDGEVEYAQWKHPFEKPKTIAQADVDGLRCFIRPGDTAIDVGAHTGDTTVPMALACGPDGLTIALEPNPYVFKVLEENARLNRDKTNIVPLNFAATEDDGDYQFHYWDASFGNGGYLSRLNDQRHGHRYPLRVTGRNLERYLRAHFADRLSRLTFVKTDCEGYDKDVLRSLRGVLKETRPVVVCEVHKKLDASERGELFGVLSGMGYALHRYAGGAAPIGEALARDDLMKWPRLDVVALPEGVDRATWLAPATHSASGDEGDVPRTPAPETIVTVEGRATRVRRARRTLKVVGWVAAAWAVLTVTPVIALRWIDPPTSAFMIQRRVEGVLNPARRVSIRYQWVDMDRISKNARLAMIAAEDQRFVEHDGFDFEAIEKAHRRNQRGGRLRGASTISQQVAKNLFLWPGRSWFRKAVEAGYTVLIEVLWPKERILEVYLNIAEFGDGIYGVSAASRAFFDRSAARLSRYESALLAAVLPNPKRFHAEKPSKYVQRRAWWIERQMIRLGAAPVDALSS
jgi:monofunctional biosynthetic peptidoglycan transglycosylase